MDMAEDKPPSLTTEDLNHLVQHLGKFALGMLVTYIRHRDEIPQPANDEFAVHVMDWTSVASEFIDMDAAIREAMDAEA